jgi:chromosome partitioning protein
MRIIAVINQKGGCGKTTVAVNLAAAFRELGRKVLLIDLDPQAHASLALNVTADDVETTVYDLLNDPRVKTSDAAVAVDEHLHLIPASPILSAIEQELAGKPGRESRLLAKLSRTPGDYDYIVIDSPPSIGLLTFNALMASTEVVIPVDPSYFSVQGLEKLRETLELLERETKHAMTMHVLMNNVERRTSFSRDIMAEVERLYGPLTLKTIICHSVRYKESAYRGMPIFRMKRVEDLQEQFFSLARELEAQGSPLAVENVDEWMVRLHGPRRVPEGILFMLNAPNAQNVYLTGEFTGWSREGIRMEKDVRTGLWRAVLHLEPGEYEYRFIVDGVWIKDPDNTDSVLNEFGQENSLLIV